MVLRKVEFVARSSIEQLLVGVALVHLVRVVEPSLAVNQDIGQRCLWITRYFSKAIGMHSMLYKVKVQWNRWITTFHLWLPPELHIWHHALPRLDQRHGRVFVWRCCLRDSCCRNGVWSRHLLYLLLS